MSIENSKKIGNLIYIIKIPKIVIGPPPPPPGKQTQPLDPVPGNFFLMDSRISVHLASIRKVEGQTKSGGANEKKNNINFSKS